MHLFTVLALITLYLPRLAQCKSIYIDRSCTNRAHWGDYWRETMEAAGRSIQRLRNPHDTDFAYVFDHLFGTFGKETLGGRYVIGMMEQARDLTVENDHVKADIRMYCDNDARWESRTNGGYEDKLNNMIRRDKPECVNEDKDVFGVSTADKYRLTTGGHKPDRVTITICDSIFDLRTYQGYKSLADLRVLDLDAWPVTDVSRVISHTIMHELMHAISRERGRWAITDVGDDPYGWQNCLEKAPKPEDRSNIQANPFANNALKNADNFAYLGLWSGLADEGYTLIRPHEDPDRDMLLLGILRVYGDFTSALRRAKRALFERRFVA